MTAWTTATVSSSMSPSATGAASIACGTFQLEESNVSGPDTVAAPASAEVGVTVTTAPAPGSVASRTV